MTDPVIPDTLEELEEKVAPKRRTYRRAAKPKDMPEPEEKPEEMKAEPKTAQPRSIGMVPGTWSGLPMWRCSRCHATTFKESDAKVHTCPQIRYAEFDE